jgi:SAM-dependent methyltransferase
MVGRLADTLIDRFASDATAVADPFCGSGAILLAAARKDIVANGVDLNPMAVLLSRTKLRGFDRQEATELCEEWLDRARRRRERFRIDWPEKEYWFSERTLDKFESLRAIAPELRLGRTRAGTAVLLAFCLSVRLCSRADQRSPKPFISKMARTLRSGRHFDPYVTITQILNDLADLYPQSVGPRSRVVRGDITGDFSLTSLGRHSHVITSPPYLNAQDYYRNFKLELFLLEGIGGPKVDAIRERFVGTDRGSLLAGLSARKLKYYRSLVRGLREVEARDDRLAAVIFRYCADMQKAMRQMRNSLRPRGKLILVCGDNLVSGVRIATWRVLDRLAIDEGFELTDRYSDNIEDRMLPPKRAGHLGLIKKEVVSAYELQGRA